MTNATSRLPGHGTKVAGTALMVAVLIGATVGCTSDTDGAEPDRGAPVVLTAVGSSRRHVRPTEPDTGVREDRIVVQERRFMIAPQGDETAFEGDGALAPGVR